MGQLFLIFLAVGFPEDENARIVLEYIVFLALAEAGEGSYTLNRVYGTPQSSDCLQPGAKRRAIIRAFQRARRRGQHRRGGGATALQSLQLLQLLQLLRNRFWGGHGGCGGGARPRRRGYGRFQQPNGDTRGGGRRGRAGGGAPEVLNPLTRGLRLRC